MRSYPRTSYSSPPVAFGRVVSGMAVLDALEAVELLNQRPVDTVSIVACGSYPPRAEQKMTEGKESKN